MPDASRGEPVEPPAVISRPSWIVKGPGGQADQVPALKQALAGQPAFGRQLCFSRASASWSRPASA
ncbi:MAG: hypothetical protein AAB528_02905, partial [Chloroflexota bacterium]